MNKKKIFKNFILAMSLPIFISNPLHAADDEVDIDLNSNFKVTEETQKNIQKKLSKFRGMGCEMVPVKDCADRIICSYVGSAHVNSKGIVAPKSFEAALKKTYRSAKMEMRKFISEAGKSEDNCIDKVGNETINGDSSKERITSLCEEISSTSVEETLKGVINVGYAFNNSNGQIAAAVGMSCSSNQMAGRLKANNLKTSNTNKPTDTATPSQEPAGVPIQQGVESSEYFNEDF